MDSRYIFRIHCVGETRFGLAQILLLSNCRQCIVDTQSVCRLVNDVCTHRQKKSHLTEKGGKAINTKLAAGKHIV